MHVDKLPQSEVLIVIALFLLIMCRLDNCAGVFLIDGVEFIKAFPQAGPFVVGQVWLIRFRDAAPLADCHAADEDVLHALLEGLPLAHYGHC